MKTKIFKHNLLAVSLTAAIGVCTGGTALAGALTYSNNDVTFLIQPKDANGTNTTLQSLGFNAVPSTNTNASKDIAPVVGFPVADLNDVDGAGLNTESCVGILPANANCKTVKPNTHVQHAIADDSDFCRGKADLPFVPVLNDPNLPVSGGAQSIATSECQFDRDNKGSGQAGVQFSGSITIGPDQAGTTLDFGILAKPFLRAFCHENPLFEPDATASMSFTINVVNDETGAEVFAFNPNGILDAGETMDEASLNTNRFCNTRGDDKIYDPLNPPAAGLVNDCTGGDPATCEYSATTNSLPEGNYTMTVAMGQDSNANKVPFTPQVQGDHYLCYKSFGSFLRQEVNLLDQFDDVNFDVLKPKMFCNPAIKPIRDPDVGILNFDAHLLSYKINEAHREPRHERQTVVMHDQFFSALALQTIRPDRLMVPSGKSLDGTIPTDQTGAINHFKCYRVRPLNSFQQVSVNIADQFTDPDLDLTNPLAEPFGKDLVLVRPTRMCTPVQKTRENGEVTPIVPDPNADPVDPRDHLMCYRVKTEQGARLNRRTEITSNNQFREEELVLKRELEFCAPATKTVVTGIETGG